MKRLYSILRVAAIAAVLGSAMVSCEQEPTSSVAKAVLGDVTLMNFSASNPAAQTVTVYSDGDWHTTAPEWITVDPSTGNVYTVKATGSNAKDLFTYNAADKFNLSSDSVFRKFTAEKELKYMYIFYDYSDKPTIDPTPFYDREGNLIPIYKYNEEGKEERIENWEDVKLYDENGIQIPKQISGNANKGSVRFDSKGNPAPVFDEAGNPIYFCDDYGQLDLPYNIFTLDKTHEQYEFLLTDTETLNVPNTEDWT